MTTHLNQLRQHHECALRVPPDLTWILCGSAAWQYSTLAITHCSRQVKTRNCIPTSPSAAVATTFRTCRNSRCLLAYVAAAAQDLKWKISWHPRLRDYSAKMGHPRHRNFFGWESTYPAVNSYPPSRQMPLACGLGCSPLFFAWHART